MQPPFSCVPKTFSAIEKTLSPARLGRYLGEAKGDKNYALRLYVWNARLCEAFYFSTQICEVALRNSIHQALKTKHGDNWHSRGSFLCTLPKRLQDELAGVEKAEIQVHGQITLDHLVSGLSLGFWQHLLSKPYSGVFWPHQFRSCFPHKPATVELSDLYWNVDRFRQHRNRIAHHKPVFDRSPQSEFEHLRMLIGWICPDTLWLVTHLSKLQQVISLKPQP